MNFRICIRQSLFSSIRGLKRKPLLCCNSKNQQVSAGEVAIKYYAAFNDRDLDRCMEYFAKDIVYEDLVYKDAFVGDKSLRNYFKKVMDTIDADLKFCIDDYSEGRDGKTGILWHVEVDGVEMPFSRGCSFVRVDENGKITFARDIVEPFIKPGNSTTIILKLLSPILKSIGPALDKFDFKSLPSPLWIGYLVYIWYLLFSNIAPGVPCWEISPETLSILEHESFNFFFIGDFLKAINIDILPITPEHPVHEALFNFVAAWGLLFLPPILNDRKTKNMSKISKWSWWTATMFLTNFFFAPYNIIRQGGEGEGEIEEGKEKPAWQNFITITGFLIGILSLTWGFIGRPEFGDLSERLNFLINYAQNDRVFFAFLLDITLYTILQTVILSDSKSVYKYIPFIGLAAANLEKQ